MKRVVLLLLSIVLCFSIAYGAEKEMTVAWEQEASDLPENGGDLAKWNLYRSEDPALVWGSWILIGEILYNGGELTHTFTVTVPDGEETSLWFKMTAVDSAGNESAPSDVQEGAPTVIDFKPPVPAVLSASYESSTKMVTLTWTTDPGDTDIQYQKIYKSSTPGGPYTDISPGVTLTSPHAYQVQPSDSGKYLYFVAILVDYSGNTSQNSNEVAVKLAMGVPFNIRVTVNSQ